MKSFRIFYTPASTKHIKEIATWYNKQKKRTGETI